MSSYCTVLQSINHKLWRIGSFGSNSGVNEKCNVIILGDKVKVAVMQSNCGPHKETILVNGVVCWNER